jgi:Zn-dependent protease/CBS domain-containing protein
MRWSIKLGRIAGTEVRIHITFLIFLVWLGLIYYLLAGAEAAVEGLVFIVALFGCVLLHELGHVLTARAFGIRTPDITLLPIGGVARLQRMPDMPWQELLVALAGPAVSLVLAIIFYLFLPPQAEFGNLALWESPGVALLVRLASANVTLAVFNLIPAFPMDGGRVLRALLAMVMNYNRATQIAATIGQGLAFVFGFLGLFGNPMLIFIALFIYLGASQEASMAQMKEVSAGLPVSAAMVTLPARATLDDAVEALLRTSQHEFPVVDDGRLLGLLTREDMIAAFQRKGGATPVNEVMHKELPTVRPNDPLDHAFQLMEESACPVLPMVDGQGRLQGLITPENVGELMLVQSQHPRDGIPAWRHGTARA